MEFEGQLDSSGHLFLFVVVQYDSFEDLDFLEKVVAWTEKFVKKHPTREVRGTVMDTEGRSVYITRYLRAIRPPEELIENGETSIQTVVSPIRPP